MVDQVNFYKQQGVSLRYKKWDLHFLKPAKTSRNTLLSHRVYYLILSNEKGEQLAISEAAPLAGLSPEFHHMEAQLDALVQDFYAEGPQLFSSWSSSLLMAWETLWWKFQKKMFFREELPLVPQPINGLVWMNDIRVMYEEALFKVQQGFKTIKFKVGQFNHQEEWEMIKKVRDRVGDDVVIRLDANGAYQPTEALSKLEDWFKLNVHSIEQPIAAGQHKSMRELCKESPVPIALDEELIGISSSEKRALLEEVMPQFIIMKPTLHGGFSGSDEWIEIATKLNIQWWGTSALESNIGLDAIARWTLSHQVSLPQGLGTGGLYSNNWESPWEIIHGMLSYNTQKEWKQPW